MSASNSDKALIKNLVKEKLLTKFDVETVNTEHKKTGESFTSILLRHGHLDKRKMRDKISKMYDLPTIDLFSFEIDKSVLELIPEKECRKYKVIPVSKAGNNLVVAFADPTSLMIKDRISFISRCKIQMVIALDIEISATIDKYYKTKNEDAGKFIAEMHQKIEDEIKEDEATIEDFEDSDDPVVLFVKNTLIEAINTKVSDIHIEPYENYLRIRFRIDGSLIEKYRPPTQVARTLSSRLKIMSKLDITETRKPQDGRIKLKVANGPTVDFRVSIIPTINGEKVVLRILDKSNLKLNLRDLGFEQDELNKFLKALRKPQGLILTTGPTGSGKTTTLYSALHEIHDPSINISTAEDPVEFNMEGINQIQVKPDIGFGFAEALRSFLRQDPDVILVGEIRDKVTAEIAFQASATGHLVLSTLHTNDATKTIDRLVQIGIPTYLITSSVELIMAQRLIKKICPHCKQSDSVTSEVLLDLGVHPSEIHDFKPLKGAGCQKCDGTGMSGRVAIYEIMTMSDELREAIMTGSSDLQLRTAALKGGMTSLRMSGIVKVKKGITSIQEVMFKTIKDPEIS